MKAKLLFDKQFCVMVDPRLLRPHPRNATISLKKHDPVMYEQLKKALLAGWKEPLKVQAATELVIGGHQRLEISLDVPIDEVPVLYENVDDRTALKLLLADNARFGHQDSLPILTENILELDAGDIDLEELGLDMALITHLVEWAPSKVAEEEIPDATPAKPVVCKSCGAIQ